MEEHRRLGADLSVDVPYKWLRFFLDDSARFDEITRDYGSGAMLTGDVKQQLISVLQVCSTSLPAAARHGVIARPGMHEDTDWLRRCRTHEAAATARLLVQDLVGRHQKARAMVSDTVVDAFMQQRNMPDLWGP